MADSKLQQAAEIEDLLRAEGYKATIMDVSTSDGRQRPGDKVDVRGYTLTIDLQV